MSDHTRIDGILARIRGRIARQRPYPEIPRHVCKCGKPAPWHVSRPGPKEGFYCKDCVPELG